MLTSSSIFSASASSLFWGACRRTLTVVPLPFLTPHTLFAAATFFSFRSYRRLNRKDHWWAPKAKIVLPRGSQGDAFSTEKSVSADGYDTSWYTKYSRLLPCPSHNTAPRIEHLVVFEEGNVLDYISKALQLPSLYVADLIHFGAIYYALVCPRPPPSATAEQVQIYRKVTEPSVLRKRSSLNGKTVREAQKTHRITDANEFVEAGTYLRVHVHPKRYPRCYEVDWKSRIIAVTDSYVVLDKPAATSVGGSSDNIEETCATFTSRVLGLGTPLKTTHQLDNCTEGCLVLAKTKEFCSAFHEWIREKQVKKLYLALTAAPVPTGILSHYMRPVNLAPRLVSREYIEGWHLCQLEVLECKEVPWPKAQVVKSHSIEDCGWPSNKTAYECKINLLTGKTHQVRAQLAAIGSPIVGDSMYMPAAMAEISNPRLNPFGVLGSAECLGDDDRAAAMSGWISCHGKEPNSAIGLQASEISWNHGECAYQAGVPCWVDTDGLFS